MIWEGMEGGCPISFVCLYLVHPSNDMMTSSNGKKSALVAGLLCGKFTGHPRIPAQKPVTRSFDVLFDLLLKKNGWVSYREAGELRRHRAHYDVTVMICHALLFILIQYQLLQNEAGHVWFLAIIFGMHRSTLQWRHNEHDGVSNQRRLDCLLNRLFRRRSKKAPTLPVTGLSEGILPVTGEFPTQRASNAGNVSIW